MLSQSPPPIRPRSAGPTQARSRTADDDEAAGSTTTGDPGPGVGPRAGRAVVTRLTTTAACLVVLFALIAPNELGQITPGAFVRIPVEGLLGAVLLLVLPTRTRRAVAVIIGVALGALTLTKILDLGFFTVLARPFDPVLDWALFDDALAFLTDSVGPVGAIGTVLTATMLAAAVLVLTTLSVLRLARLAPRRHTTGVVAALTAAWLTCAVLGTQIVPGLPVAATNTATFVYDRAAQMRASVLDQQTFARQAAADAFADTPGDRLLTALRGKDVIVCFVESYGRDAIEDPEFAPRIGAVLDAGTRRLGAAGYLSRSAYLTSPVTGSGSWLAHATLLSGLWVDNQQRYHSLVSSDRLTLSEAFRRANWRTVAVMPGTTRAWPEGTFYGYDRVDDVRGLGYRGPSFGWSSMPDQYTLSAFEHAERANPDRGSVMAQIDLTSSHAPWAPLPRLIAWDDIGDGSIYGAMAAQGERPEVVWSDPARVRSEYRRSLEYTLNSLISYVETYGDDNLVLVFLGDHQAVPLVTGAGASRDVPITLIARDPTVVDRISGWGWHEGLKPGPGAPVWPMDAFRDRFLTAFGP